MLGMCIGKKRAVFIRDSLAYGEAYILLYIYNQG